ncbi:aggregation-promoting factor C-terminal-like domain-containing protein [Lapidilactobacillus bayanensis]|uniref:aggregation-promoting factor C-terminal-like domain-containing protein n=1 Tax=Lapidilactobacillus bayanensis TaxID=2485998 RepID=UPI001CDCB7C7|nr:hypothetical protein [Lapidilactobacillus bayanensis]
MKFFHNKGLATRILFSFTVAGAVMMSNLNLVAATPTTQVQDQTYYPTTETITKVTAVHKMVQDQKTIATAQTRRAQQIANTAEQLANQKQQAEIAKKKAEEAKKIAAAKKAAAEKLAVAKARATKVALAKATAKKLAAQKVTTTKTTAKQSTPTVTNTKTASVSGSDASAKAVIAGRESGGSYTARNGQYVGKYQLSASYLHGDYSPANQERVANSYVTSRYGSWSNALAHWNSCGWY